MTDRWIDFAVGSFKIGVGHHAGTAVAGTADIDDVEVTSLDDAVEMGINKIEPRGRAPVSQQARLDMLGFQRLQQQWILEQIDLPNRQIVRGPPISIETRQLLSAHGIQLFALGR